VELFSVLCCILYGSAPSSCCRSLGVILPLLGNSSKHVTVTARQRPSYYCVCVGNSNFFSLLFLFWKRNKSRLMTSPCSVSVSIPLFVARQRLDKNIHAATNTDAKIEELLDASFYTRCVLY
jgi:hypothetical protein